MGKHNIPLHQLVNILNVYISIKINMFMFVY